MSLRPLALARTALALVALLALAGCGDGNNGSRALCDEVCAHIADECAPLEVRDDCVEECRVEVRSRVFANSEDGCLECCVNVTLPANKCTDVCESEIGFSICLDDRGVCDPECDDQIADRLNPMCAM